jgi:hypothetical protein
MIESAPKPAQGELHQTTLEPLPREFGVDDVVNVQNYMRHLHDEALTDNADYIPSQQSLYDTLTEAPTGTSEVEPLAAEHSFDKPVSTLLAAWGERNGVPGQAPQTLTETLDVFTKNPKFDEDSPIHFQGGAEYVTGRFVHVATGRAMGKHREQATRRYYLNPRADKMGHVVEQLTGAALQTETPLYFKFVNVATGKPDKRTLGRNDRVVIYASDNQTALVEDVLSRMVTDDPEAFAGRKIAGFGEVLADGITRADEVTLEQNERFKGHSEGTSFNDLRSKLIFEATMSVTKDLVSFPEYGSVKVGGQTIRQKFASELSKAISKRQAGTVIKEDDPLLQEAVQLGLEPERLQASGKFSEGAVRAIQDSVGRVARDVLPHIQPDSLLRGYEHHIKELAPKYGINRTYAPLA